MGSLSPNHLTGILYVPIAVAAVILTAALVFLRLMMRRRVASLQLGRAEWSA